LMKYDC